MRMENKKFVVSGSDPEVLQKCLIFIEDSLQELSVDNRLSIRTILIAEELIPQFVKNAVPDSCIRVQVQRFVGDVNVYIHSVGREFDPVEEIYEDDINLDQIEDEEAQQAIRAILLRSYGDRVKVTHKKGCNRVRIAVGQSDRSFLFLTFAALIVGVLFGFLMKYALPTELTDGFVSYLLDPVKTMFMNGLKMIIAPVVFFSIASCIAQFKDLSALGRIALKVMGMYTMTTVVAVLLSLALSMLLQPGIFGSVLSEVPDTEVVSLNTDIDTSVLNMIINIVPSNFISPFLESDTLQIIFLGILCGVAVGMIGKYSSFLQDLFESCNSLFLTITTIFSRFIPLAVLCSTSIMIVSIGSESIMSVLGFVGTFILAIIGMLIVYEFLILILGRLNPLTFFRKIREGMLTSFSLSSSSAAMPTNMKICTDKLGISPKVCSFSIPLGATVNMDGTSITLTISGLFLARIYGIEVPGSVLVTLIITIVLLSVGAPGVPGSAMVCLSVVLKCLNVPIEAIGVIMGILPFVEMFATMSNTTGDMATSLIAAKSEALLDVEKYNER